MKKKYLCVLAALYVALLLWPTASLGLQKMTLISKDPVVKKDDASKSKVIPARQKDSLDRWLETLASYEGAGHGTHFRRLDNNDAYSYSCLQFQEATFKGMAVRYHILTPADLVGEDPAPIYDCAIQMQVARAMFLDNAAAAAQHWRHTIAIRHLDLPVIPPTP